MNLEFHSIDIEGFKSITCASLSLEREPGLYFMTGKNRIEPGLGANGAGKSTLCSDAITFALFGKTARGVKGPSLKSWHFDGKCQVSLKFALNNVEHCIIRTQGPNSLTLDNKPIVQLEDFLGISYDEFTKSVIFGQFNRYFLDLPPAEKLKTFSSILSLDFWEKLTIRASGVYTADNLKLNTLSGKLSESKNRLELLKKQQSDIQIQLESFDSNKSKKVALLEKEIQEILNASSTMESALTELNIKLTTHNIAINEHSNLYSEKRNVLNTTQSNYADLDKKCAIVTTQLNSVKTEYSKWGGIDKACPYCGQMVEHELIIREKERILKYILLLSKQKETIDTQLNDYKSKIKNLTTEVTQLEKQLSDFTTTLIGIRDEINQTQHKKDNSLLLIRKKSEEIEELKGQLNPHIDFLSSLLEQIQRDKLYIQSISTEITMVGRAMEGSNFWVKGFKELRMWLIMDAIKVLELESNNALVKLGMPEWVLSFQIERETTTNTVSKGFHTFVCNNTYGSEVIPVDLWSGGETQRLKLATTIGLAELICGYRGFSCNIEVWDEPTELLSEEGINDLLGFLHNRAMTSKKTIFFVDQKSLISPHFHNTITVEKTLQGTSITET